MTLGRTGIQTSLLGMGTGSVGVKRSSNQVKLGQEKFNRLVRHAYRNVPYYRSRMHERGLTPEDIRTQADLHKPPYLRYNNFGYTVGGPIVPIKDRAFFFWSQEWRRIQRAPSSLTANVPNPDWLNDPNNSQYVAPGLRDANAVKM